MPKNYRYDNCTSLPNTIINEKTLYLIEKGWVFWYAPQNVTSTHDKSFMHEYVMGGSFRFDEEEVEYNPEFLKMGYLHGKRVQIAV